MNPDQTFNPDRREFADEQPNEIEVKVVNLGDPEAFQARVQALGGALTHPRHLLRDTAFRFSPEAVEINKPSRVRKDCVSDIEALKQSLNLLGADVVEENEASLVVSITKPSPKRTVRIRQDGDQLTLTVKTERPKDSSVDERVEREVKITRAQDIEDLLSTFGYSQHAIREKYRTRYLLGNAKVELNEGPAAPPWAEIEASSPEEVLRTASALGYKNEDLANTSDSNYYKNHGITEEQLAHLVFEDKKE